MKANKTCECGIPPQHHPTRHDEHRLSAAREGVVKALVAIAHKGAGATGPHGVAFENCTSTQCKYARDALRELEEASK